MGIEVDEVIAYIKEQYEYPKNITVLCHPDVFKILIANYKRKLKRCWREQRHLYLSGTTKHDWMVTIGVNVDVLNHKINKDSYAKNIYNKEYIVSSQRNCPIFHKD